jgi:NACHT domain
MSTGTSVGVAPYVGPRPFETGDRRLFFGREREAHEISSLVLANKFFMLYAASGAGKTSLVSAGVRPLLSDELDVLPTARFQIAQSEMPADVANAYTYAVLAGWAEPGKLHELARTTLAEYLESRSRRILPGGLLMSRLLVFDQFEELFTTRPERWQERRTFLEQLTDASRSHADLRILVVLREDFLSHLLDFADASYGGMKDRYFLQPLRRPAAELAIESPAAATGRSFQPDAIDDLVKRLMANRVNVGDSRIVHVEGEFVEPVLLQVACQALWAALPPTVSTITLTHVRELADVDASLARFYSDAVRKAAEQSSSTEREIREWVQRNLVTPEGTRGTVHVGAEETAGLPNTVVTSLEGKFLRAEFRAGARWLEITHDSLLAPIEQSNREYLASPKDNSLAFEADHLAIAVQQHWVTEVSLRRLNDPYPLPVRWTPAHESLADPWESLVRLVTSGAGWRTSRSSPSWTADASNLDGRGSDLAQVLDRVPTRRLVVLGEPGSGKTMLMARLVLDMLAGRTAGDPVPVLVPVAQWNPVQQDLRSWLSAQLSETYPHLAALAKKGRKSGNLIRSLLDARLILPILDGLDEIPSAFREQAIQLINSALHPGEPIVVTCRTRQYIEAVRPPGHDPIRLQGAAVVEIRPLDASAVADYLRADAGLAAAARWDPVLAALGTQAPISQVLTSPLMVGLAAAIYNPRPGERSSALRDPAELCSPAFYSQGEVESFLYDAFIPSMYRSDTRGHWTESAAARWLAFLAVDLEGGIFGPDLAWWRIARAAPARALGLAAGGVLGLVLGSAGGLAFGPQWAGLGAAAGLLPGLAIGLGLAGERLPSYGVRWKPIRAVCGGASVGIAALISGAVIDKLTVGMAFALLFALFAGLAAGLQGTRGGPQLEVASSPHAALARDRRTALAIGTMTAAAIGVPVALAAVGLGLAGSITLGIVSGIAAGLAAISYQSAWPRWQLARGWLGARQRLPWRLMAFLEEAYYRGVLRQSGPVYQFRHAELQRRLASLPLPTTDRIARSD